MLHCFGVCYSSNLLRVRVMVQLYETVEIERAQRRRRRRQRERERDVVRERGLVWTLDNRGRMIVILRLLLLSLRNCEAHDSNLAPSLSYFFHFIGCVRIHERIGVLLNLRIFRPLD